MFKTIQKDFSASIVVFLVALPLCLGIALASGAPLFAGLIAGIVGGILVGALSGSQLSVSGPAAGLTVIILAAISDLGDYRSFLLAVCLAGILQFILGAIKAGSIAYFFPASVIKGMLAAIGLILILKQIPHALGYIANFEGDEQLLSPSNDSSIEQIIAALANPKPAAIIICLTAMLVIWFHNNYISKKYAFFNNIPGSLVAVLMAIFIQQYLLISWPSSALTNQQLVTIPVSENFDELITQFTLPNFSAFKNLQVYVVGLTIAIVGSLETLLSIEAADKIDPKKRITPASRELKAQGIGNLVSGLIGGLPVTAVIVRSSANLAAGAQSKLSAIFHGLLILVAVVFLPNWLNLIPLSCLAAILFIVGYKLITPEIFKQMYAQGIANFIPFIATTISILLTDMLLGIAIGIIISLLFVLKPGKKAGISVSNLEVNKPTISLSGRILFYHKARFLKALHYIGEPDTLKIDASHTSFLDFDMLETITTVSQQMEERGTQVDLIGLEQYTRN